MKHRKFYCKNYIECSGNLPKYQPKDCEEQCYSCMDEIIEHHFNKKTMNKKTISFGQALSAVQEGKLIRRSGWNGKNMFVFQRPEDFLDVEMIIHKVKSLPQSIKDYFGQQNEKGLDSNAKIKFQSYLCLKNPDDSIVNGWVASQSDIVSEDWEIVDLNAA